MNSTNRLCNYQRFLFTRCHLLFHVGWANALLQKNKQVIPSKMKVKVSFVTPGMEKMVEDFPFFAHWENSGIWIIWAVKILMDIW